MSDRPLNVLFLCTGNSARSILGEAILNHDGAGRFKAYSAGSNPTGEVNPWAFHTLDRLGYPAGGYSSKNWTEFAEGPEFDRLFLEGMIQHHQGALDMVDELLSYPDSGNDPMLSDFASSVVADQSAEILRMQSLLSEL